MEVLEKITNIFICSHVKVCRALRLSALHLEQQLFYAIENMHFSTYVLLFIT